MMTSPGEIPVVVGLNRRRTTWPLLVALLVIVASLLGVASVRAQFHGTGPLGYVTYPEKNQYLKPGQAFTFTAGANDFAGINRVEFYIDGKRVGRDFRRPFKLRVPGLSKGKHYLRVKAVNVYGRYKFSPIVPVYVGIQPQNTPPPASFSRTQRQWQTPASASASVGGRGRPSTIFQRSASK